MDGFLARVAFVFPGQGSQSVGMGRGLFDAFPGVRDLFAEADQVLGEDLSRLIFTGPEEELRQTVNTQPALVLMGTALYRTLGLRPALVAGHSLGEYTALVAAGALSLADALRLVRRRGTYMQEAVPRGGGAMLALLGVSPDAVRRAVESAGGPVEIANDNAPDQIVLAGTPEAVRRAAESSGARKVVELAVSAPFHCRLMRPAEERLGVDLDRTPFSDLDMPLYTNVDARRITTGAEARDALKRQVTRTVRWTESVRRMIDDDGIDTFVELGPGGVLGGLIRRIAPGVRRLAAHDPDTLESTRVTLGARG